VDIKEWKFPLFDFLLNGGLKNEEDEDDPTKQEQDPLAAGIPGIETILDQIFQGHIMKVAYVEVSWPDGARRDHVSLTYLLTNNKALDEYLLTKKNIFDGVIKKMAGANAPAMAATGPSCTASDPPGSTPIPGGGGCMHPGNITRRPDGSMYAADGSMIAPPPAPTPPTPTGGNPPTGRPNPGAGGVPPNRPNPGG
jgi:hypothetical protein